MNDVLAYFITWTCYGTHLPGDERWWTKWGSGERQPQSLLAHWCYDQMIDSPVRLVHSQREQVEQVIAEHCDFRGWILHAANCRTNHCHVVVTAPDYHGNLVIDQLKSWATRRLREREPKIDRWWTRGGSVRSLFDEESLVAAVEYVTEGQDRGGSRQKF